MAGITYDGIASTEIDSQIFSGTTFYTNTLSGTNLTLGGSVVAGRINDGNGAIFSANVGSTTTYGAKVQAGSVVMSAGSTGTIVFGTAFNTNAYYLVISPGSNALANSPGSVVPYATTQLASGANLTGAANANYNWIAVGL